MSNSNKTVDTLVNLINTLGSIASLTGISLLYFTNNDSINRVTIFSNMVSCTILLSIAVIIITILLNIFNALENSHNISDSDISCKFFKISLFALIIALYCAILPILFFNISYFIEGIFQS